MAYELIKYIMNMYNSFEIIGNKPDLNPYLIQQTMV